MASWAHDIGYSVLPYRVSIENRKHLTPRKQLTIKREESPHLIVSLFLHV